MYDYQYLIHLIYCAVHDVQPREKPEEVSFVNVLELGKIHEVANIAFLSVEKLENKPEPEVFNDWKIFYYLSAERDTRQWLLREDVVQAMHAEGIRTLEAQGTITKTLYPATELRMMSDIDFIIDLENIEKAKEIMRARGCFIDETIPGEICAKIENLENVEFHTDFFNDYMYNRKERFSAAINQPFAHAEPSADDPLTWVLNDDYYYLYSILHIIKHFETAGCGIRRVLDIYYLNKAYADKIDKALFDSVIDGNGFRRSYETLLALEGVWFEDKPTELDLSEAVHDIVLSGNHGTGEIFTRNNIRKDRSEGKHFVKLRKMIWFIFPSKQYVYLGYPVCRERGYGTVRCWFYRIFATLKAFRFWHTIDYFKTIFKSK